MRKKEEERERKERERGYNKKESRNGENTASCYNMARFLIP